MSLAIWDHKLSLSLISREGGGPTPPSMISRSHRIKYAMGCSVKKKLSLLFFGTLIETLTVESEALF